MRTTCCHTMVSGELSFLLATCDARRATTHSRPCATEISHMYTRARMMIASHSCTCSGEDSTQSHASGKDTDVSAYLSYRYTVQLK